jgi:hypothetical protein
MPSPPRRRATSSASVALSGGRPESRHRPRSSASVPASSAPSTSSRTYSALPRLLSITQCSAAWSSGPPSAASTRALTASSPSGSSSSRCEPASFHSETIASGHGSPERTVATVNAVPVSVRWSTSAADTGSSNCASSTPRTTPRSASALRRISSSGSSERTSSGIRPANAPSGTLAALLVACAQWVIAPSPAAASSASRASRDLPTPAGALTTTPGRSPRARAIAASSPSRPMSGQAAATPSVTAPRTAPRRRCRRAGGARASSGASPRSARATARACPRRSATPPTANAASRGGPRRRWRPPG